MTAHPTTLRRKRFRGALVRLAVVAAVLSGLATVATGALRTSVASAAPPANVWPEFHHDALETGSSPDPLISDTVAPSLGVKWMSNLVTQALSSPVVAYNSTLAKTVVYTGGEAGYLTAFDQSTGATLWSTNLGSALRSTPLIEGNFIWAVPTYAPKLYKINATTGAVVCSATLATTGDASPVMGTPPGGSKTIYVGMNDLGAASGPLYSISESGCHQNWAFTGYNIESGMWAGISFALDKNGRALVLFGTSDHDASVYALDAKAGTEAWRFQTANPPPGLADVGAGIAVTAPGVNGFADGVAYVSCKDGNLYALDLTTGAQDWVYNYSGGPPKGNGSRSTASIVGNQVVFGTTQGIFDVNAVTGKLIWNHPDPVEVLSSVAVIGPSGHQVVAYADVAGLFQVISLATGSALYSYQTHNYIAGSPADVSGNILITSADGFLYEFAPGGANSGSPTTAVTSPANGSTVANPNGNLTISGTASAPAGVKAVSVDVQIDGSTGPWWDGATNSFTTGAINNPATLSSPGATSTNWSLSVPIPARGTVVLVQANAIDNNNIADTTPDKSGGSPGRVNFTVSASTTAPTVQPSAFRIAPGANVTITGGGYQGGESVALTLPTSPTMTLANVTATSSGAIPSTVITIPAKGVPFGPISLIATGQTSGRQGSAPIYISNNWDQWRDNAAKTGFESNDTALDGSVGANGKSFLDQAYSYPSGGTIHSSPSIDNGLAFFGNDAGTFTALNVTNSAPKWTKTFSAGIDSTAAVDGGLVIVGVENSSVVAMNETTGAIVWTTSTGGSVESSPLVTGGVVYVGADDHKVYALNETTGAVIWTQALTGAVHSSPAFVSKQSEIVVGDDSGNVSALATSNGVIKWHSLTGGAVTATPMSFSNNVYVGSADGKEYAFVAKTGAVLWTFTTGGAIVASNVTFGTNIGVGSEDNTVYYLSSTTGAVANSLPGTQPIVGMSGSVNFVVATTSAGTAFASRVNGADQTWKYDGDGVGFASSPTELNGTVFITGLDMGLHAFTVPGGSVR